MEKVASIRQLLARAARFPTLVGALALVILAAAIIATTLQVRRNIREQIARRDAEVLHAVMAMEYANDVEQGIAGPITDPGNQLSLVLKSTELLGVFGVRLYDAQGRFVEAFPPYVAEAELDPRDLAVLGRLKPVSRFHPSVPMNRLVPVADLVGHTNTFTPLLEVSVPLHTAADTRPAGIAQFLLEGGSIAAEFARLDRHLARQGAVEFGVGGALLAAGLGLAFRRLRRAHALLAERTDSLVKANQELSLAAKTSALGAVAAHLIHGLKNPLAGLQTFVDARGAHAGNGQGESDWRQAVASTQRMQETINRVIGVLRENETGARYEVTLEELGGMVAQRVAALARARGVNFRMELPEGLELPNCAAHLVALILENIVQNGVEATPTGGTVELRGQIVSSGLTFEVSDEGPGFPAGQSPFAPCRSAKQGGSGIGLALSKQLANHLGAALELRNHSPAGCVFVLDVPLHPGAERSNEQLGAPMNQTGVVAR